MPDSNLILALKELGPVMLSLLVMAGVVYSGIKFIASVEHASEQSRIRNEERDERRNMAYIATLTAIQTDLKNNWELTKGIAESMKSMNCYKKNI